MYLIVYLLTIHTVIHLELFRSNQSSDVTKPKFRLPNIENLPEPSELVLSVVAYVAGAVVKSLLTSNELSCGGCRSWLVQQQPSIQNTEHIYSKGPKELSLIRIKDKGGLKMPSVDVITICQAVEKLFRAVNKNTGRAVKDAAKEKIIKYLKKNNAYLFCGNHNDQTDHMNNLINSIVDAYLKIKFHAYAAKKCEEISGSKLRQKLNKAIIFSGQ